MHLPSGSGLTRPGRLMVIQSSLPSFIRDVRRKLFMGFRTATCLRKPRAFVLGLF